MIRHPFFVILGLVSLYIAPFIAAEPSIQADPFYSEARHWQEPLTTDQLIILSLKASGMDEASITLHQETLEQHIEKFSRDILPELTSLTPYEQGEGILQWIHEEILDGYVEPQTRMDILLDQGTYNCVSSAALYLIFTSQAGLEVRGVETHDHAFCTLILPEGNIDVETTTPLGFDPGSQKDFDAGFAQTGFRYVPPGNYRDRSESSQREIMALILQNRMAFHQRRNDHAPVVNLAVNRWELLGTEQAKTDMNDAFQNWAAWLNGRGNYKEALDFILMVSQRFELLEANSTLLYHLAHNQLIQDIEKPDLEDVEALIASIQEVLQDQHIQALEQIYHQENLSRVIHSADYEEALLVLRQSQDEIWMERNRYVQWIYFLQQNRAVEISEDQGWYEGWQFLESLPEEEGNLPVLAQTKEQMRYNWSSEQHNLFVQAISEQDYSAARAIIINGLALDPQNPMLLEDLRTMDREGL